MKAKQLLGAFLLMVLVQAAQAVPALYTFTGIFTDIRASGAGIAYGTTFVATYLHDDSVQVGSLIEPARKLYLGGSLNVNAGALSLNAGNSTELQVFDNWSNAIGGYNNDDGYFVSGRSYDAQGYFLIQFDLWDFTGTTLKSLAVPTQAEFLELATSSGRMWIRRFENGVETGLAMGAITSVSPIPEPGTAAFLLAGLTLIAHRCVNRCSIRFNRSMSLARATSRLPS